MSGSILYGLGYIDSDDAWENYVRRFSDAKGMRNKRFPYYEDWLILFGKDRANGNLAEGPGETVAAMVNEEAAADQGFYSPVIDFSMGGNMDSALGADREFSASHGTPQSAAPTTSGKKRKRTDDDMSKALSTIVETFGGFFKDSKTSMAEIANRIGYAQDLSVTRRQVNDALKALPLETSQRLRAASMIVDKPQFVDLFFSLSEDEMEEWVQMLLAGLLTGF